MAGKKNTVGATVKADGEKEFVDQLRNIGKSINIVTSELKAATSEFDKNDKSMKSLTIQSQSLKEQLKLQEERLKASKDAWKNSADQFGENNYNTKQWQVSINNTQATINKLKKELEGINNEMKVQADHLNKLSDGLDKASEKLTKYGTKLSLAVTTPIVGAGTYATKLGMDFETGFAKASTLITDTSINLENLQKDLIGLSSDLNITTKSLNDGFLNALSSSVAIGEDYSGMMGFLESNAKLATAGFTDFNTTIDATTSIINAYGFELDQTSRIHEMLINTQTEGKTSVGQLAASLSNVIPTAAELKLEIEQVGASYAALTAQGVPTAQASTQIRSALLELSRTGTQASDTFKELTGKTFKEYLAAGNTLADAMAVLKKHADSTGIGIADIFSRVEGANAALILTSETGAKKFADSLETMRSSVDGVDTAFNKIADTSEFRWSQSMNKLNNSLIGFRDALLPIVDAFADKIDGLASFLSELDDGAKKAIVTFGMFAASVGPAMVGMGSFVRGASDTIKAVKGATEWFGKLKTAITTAETAQEAFNAVMAMSAVGITAAIAGISLLAVGINYLASTQKRARKETEKRIAALNEEIAENERALGSINSLAEEYNNLTTKTDLNASKKDRLKELNRQLIEDYPELLKFADAEGNFYKITAEMIEVMNKKKQEEIRLANEQLAAAELKKADEPYSNYAQTKNAYDSEMNSALYDLGTEDGRKYAEALKKAIDEEIGEALNERAEILKQQLSKSLMAMSETFENTFVEIGLKNASDAFINNFIEELDAGEVRLEDFTDKIKELGDKITKGVPQKAIDNYNELYKKFATTGRGAISLGVAYEELDKAIKEATEGELGAKEWLGSLNDIAKSTQKIFQENTELLTKNAEALKEEAKGYSDLITSIQKVKDEIKEYGAVSGASLDFIIDKYPALMQYIGDTGRLQEELAKEEERLNKKRLDSYSDLIYGKIKNDDKFYSQVVENNSELIKQLNEKYDIDLKNFTSLAEAKLKIEKELLDRLSDMWSKYFKIVDGAIQFLGDESQSYGLEAERTRLQKELDQFNKDLKGLYTETPDWQNAVGKTFDSGSKSKKDSTSDALKKQAQSEMSDLKWQLDMKYISNKEYFDKLEVLNNKFFTKNSEDWKRYALEIKNGREKLLDDEVKANKKAVDDKYNHSMGWIDDRNFYGDWDKFGNDVISAYERVQEALDEAFANAKLKYDEYVDYTKELERKTFTENKNQYNDRYSNSMEWISDRDFYDDWDKFGDDILSAYQRVKDYTDKYYNDGILSYKEYLDKIKELDRKMYSTLKSQSEESIDSMLKSEKSRIDEAIKALRKQVSDLQKSWTVQDRSEDLAELYNQEKIFRNAVTIEGANQYKKITDDIKRLEREEQLYELEKKNNEIIEELEQEYRRLEEQKNDMIQQLIELETINGVNINSKIDEAIAAVQNMGIDMVESAKEIINNNSVVNQYNYGGNTINTTQNNNVSDNVDMMIINQALNGRIR